MRGIPNQFFLEIAENHLYTFSEIKGGINGPYNDPHTPIRNAAHWAISFSKAFDLTKDDKYKVAALELLDKTLSSNFRTSYTYIHRFKKGKDQSNGTIGPAWNIEAFVEGYRISGDDKYLVEIERLINLIPQDRRTGFWYRITPSGEKIGLDMTFNHQLWYCASLCLYIEQKKNPEVLKQIDLFFNKLRSNFRTHGNGLIKHQSFFYFQLKYIKRNLKRIKDGFVSFLIGKDYIYKESGYHMFNLFALAIIRKTGYEHPFFNSKKFMRSVQFCVSKELEKLLLENNNNKDITGLKINRQISINRYGYPYNPSGFELPFINQIFKLGEEKKVKLIFDTQIELTYNQQERIFDKNTEDADTLTARIYELSRYF